MGRGSDRPGVVESLAGERLGGGSQRLPVPGLKSYKGDKRETVTSVRARTVWGKRWNRWGIGAATLPWGYHSRYRKAQLIRQRRTSLCFIGFFWWAVLDSNQYL